MESVRVVTANLPQESTEPHDVNAACAELVDGKESVGDADNFNAACAQSVDGKESDAEGDVRYRVALGSTLAACALLSLGRRDDVVSFIQRAIFFVGRTVVYGLAKAK
jgi:hypothetical protein